MKVPLPTTALYLQGLFISFIAGKLNSILGTGNHSSSS
jgi:hypothetical protein